MSRYDDDTERDFSPEEIYGSPAIPAWDATTMEEASIAVDLNIAAGLPEGDPYRVYLEEQAAKRAEALMEMAV